MQFYLDETVCHCHTIFHKDFWILDDHQNVFIINKNFTIRLKTDNRLIQTIIDNFCRYVAIPARFTKFMTTIKAVQILYIFDHKIRIFSLLNWL